MDHRFPIDLVAEQKPHRLPTRPAETADLYASRSTEYPPQNCAIEQHRSQVVSRERIGIVEVHDERPREDSSAPRVHDSIPSEPEGSWFQVEEWHQLRPCRRTHSGE